MKTQASMAIAALLLAGSVTGASAQAYQGGPDSQTNWSVQNEARGSYGNGAGASYGSDARGAYAYSPSSRRIKSAPQNPNAVYQNGRFIGDTQKDLGYW